MNKDRLRRHIYTHIPVYSGDVSGAASALYELDGMTVIHDPSGCNSTYNTHDELRWNARESAVYISGLRESDAVNGNDKRLIDDTVETATSLLNKPGFIALCNSPVPDIIGTDFKAISHIIEERIGIPTFYIRTNAMHDYTVGASEALYSLAEKFAPEMAGHKDTAGSKIKLNLFGVTPFEYPYIDSIDTLYEFLNDNGFEICANWGEGTDKHPVSFYDIEKAFSADVTLVLSSIGLKAAEFLRARYGIPYVCGRPDGEHFGQIVISDIKSAFHTLNPINSYEKVLIQNQFATRNEAGIESIGFVGEPVTAGSQAAAYALSHPDKKVRLICTTETTSGLTWDGVICPHGEEEIADVLMGMSEIHGDPLFRHAMSHGRHGFDQSRQTWVDEPHLAMSGRMFIRPRK